ncbi:MAG: fimbrial protein [Lysobacteraceae bacterium]|nr:MAG: fimbrial protein [Xanthomonadaceae bacterium]
MARINLLPWREERRQQRQKEFFALLGMGAVGAILVFFAIQWFVGGLIDNQRSRNNTLTTEIASLDRQIRQIEELDRKKARLLARKEIIERLQASRSMMVHLFDELVRTIPEGVQLTNIKQAGRVLTLSGVAQSNARVSAYLRNLDNSDWLKDPDLDIIEAVDDQRNYKYEFTVRVGLVGPEDQGQATTDQEGWES